HPRFVGGRGRRALKGGLKLPDRPSLNGSRTQSEVDAQPELAREITSLAPQRREVHPQPRGPPAVYARGERVDAGQTLVEHEGERVAERYPDRHDGSVRKAALAKRLLERRAPDEL